MRCSSDFDLGRGALGIDAQLAGGLINKVNGLVRQVAVGDIALAELGGRLQGFVGDLNLVVRLIPGPQAAQYLDGLLPRWAR